ncbi:MAG: hypothetical protein E5W40_12835, partial [Mesorhizobium sp.]
MKLADGELFSLDPEHRGIEPRRLGEDFAGFGIGRFVGVRQEVCCAVGAKEMGEVKIPFVHG